MLQFLSHSFNQFNSIHPHGSGFWDSVRKVGHAAGQAHPWSKIANPFDVGFNIGQKLGKELYKATHHGHY